MSEHETILPEGWPRPRGYANGMAASGRQIYVAGQIGWDEKEELVGEDLREGWVRVGFHGCGRVHVYEQR